MYPYPNYSMNQSSKNMPTYYTSYGDDRFIPGGFVLPLILGGIGGYAIGSNQSNNQMPMYYYCPYPYCYPPMPRR